jgi:hypothetical protein
MSKTTDAKIKALRDEGLLRIIYQITNPASIRNQASWATMSLLPLLPGSSYQFDQALDTDENRIKLEVWQKRVTAVSCFLM